ncbi:MAG: aminotransferase class III-fold pyridoxal phosphate-dependent enzyme, partial [Burkholderiales bacterium]|nr:aminotransferase class III-fold pyridoxal phosphate-dependent enzyme [Burkholderiales bacterium]
RLSPVGPVYQAGTLSGNPLAMAAGLKTLELIQAPGFFDTLNARTKQLTDGLGDLARKSGAALSAQSIGGMFGLYFRPTPPESFAEVMQSDVAAFRRFFHALLERGIYLAPSAYEAGFVSAAHTDADIVQTLEAMEDALSSVSVLSC